MARFLKSDVKVLNEHMSDHVLTEEEIKRGKVEYTESGCNCKVYRNSEGYNFYMYSADGEYLYGACSEWLNSVGLDKMKAIALHRQPGNKDYIVYETDDYRSTLWKIGRYENTTLDSIVEELGLQRVELIGMEDGCFCIKAEYKDINKSSHRVAC